jgi:hypothetical protein
MDVSGQLYPQRKSPGTHWIGGWVGSRAILDAVMKRKIPSPRRESNPRTPIVQRYNLTHIDQNIRLDKKSVLKSEDSSPQEQKHVTEP